MTSSLSSKTINNKYKSTSTFASTASAPAAPLSLLSSTTSSPTQQQKKIGHREVKNGVVLFKKVPTDELKKSIQFGIVHFINEQNRFGSPFNINRDCIMQDFQVVETILYPKAGNASQPAHGYSDFKLKVYAPYGFKYLRKKLNINEIEFVHAIGETDLIEIGNPGASGSVFYKTSNDKFILKTVQHHEAEFLKSLLPAYILKDMATFYDKTNIRIIIMNNILPSDIQIHEKFDLKGSLHKRQASKEERSKSSPTYKDLDFLDMHPDGLQLDEKSYNNVIETLKRDCLILKSFEIMDYSLLLGIHNIDKENNKRLEEYYESKVNEMQRQNINNNQFNDSSLLQMNFNSNNNNNRFNSDARSNLSSPSFRINNNNINNLSPKRHESVLDKQDTTFTLSAIPATTKSGERLLLYFGIIDILQKYRFTKKVEHALKSIAHDSKNISVTNPSFYAKRFMDFMENKVFKRVQTFNNSPMRPIRPKIRENSIIKPKINEEDGLDVSNIIADITFDHVNHRLNNNKNINNDDDQETEETDSGFINNYNSLKSQTDRKFSNTNSTTNTLTRINNKDLPSEIILNGAIGRVHSKTNIQSKHQEQQHTSQIDDSSSFKSERANQKSKISDVKFTYNRHEESTNVGDYTQASNKINTEEYDEEELVKIKNKVEYYPEIKTKDNKMSHRTKEIIRSRNYLVDYEEDDDDDYDDSGTLYRTLNDTRYLDNIKFNKKQPFYVVDTIIPVYKENNNKTYPLASYDSFNERTEMYCEIYDKIKTDNVFIIDSYIPRKSLSRRHKHKDNNDYYDFI